MECLVLHRGRGDAWLVDFAAPGNVHVVVGRGRARPRMHVRMINTLRFLSRLDIRHVSLVLSGVCRLHVLHSYLVLKVVGHIDVRRLLGLLSRECHVRLVIARRSTRLVLIIRCVHVIRHRCIRVCSGNNSERLAEYIRLRAFVLFI